jgi:virginiamycin A acetyltransferase
MRAALKALIDGVFAALVLPAAVTCWGEAWLNREAEGVFGFWSHVVAVLPGHPGLYVRRAFYRLTLASCAREFHIGFGALFTHRAARVERAVYVGPYSLVGCATLREGCLIASRVSLLSGARPHRQGPGGGWRPSESRDFQRVEIGARAWVGEGAIVMVDVGASAMVGAGAVVTRRVPPGVVVAGNPARPIRRLPIEPEHGVDSTPRPFRAIG